MSQKMDPVVHFEMPAADRARMAQFYTSAFGWQAQLLGPEMGDYVVVATTETDESGAPKTPGAINGGFYPKKDDWPAQYPSVVIAVDDIHASMKKAKELGAMILVDVTEVGEFGWMSVFTDPTGATLAMWKPKQPHK